MPGLEMRIPCLLVGPQSQAVGQRPRVLAGVGKLAVEIHDLKGAHMSDHNYLRSQIRDFRKRSIQAAGPGRREFSGLIGGKRVYLYAIRDMEDPHPF